MKSIFYGLSIILCIISTCKVTGLTEHKVHNIVLYPDKHSWCKTTGIKQIVTYPGCSSIEIDNNVCVGGCFSYSIPRTMPSSPGEVITPYCDSCQPVDFEWKEVTLLCSDESDEEEEGKVEMTKKVQVITNCTCTSCEKQYEQNKNSDGHKHIGSKRSDDVPELMSLMMETHHIRRHGKDDIQESDLSEEEHALSQDTNNVRENLVEDEDEEDEKRIKNKLDKESRTLEILHLSKPGNGSRKIEDFIEISKNEHKHYEMGPHHSTIIKPDTIKIHEIVPHHRKNDDEETPSLLENQFKIHDNEEYFDQIAVESIRKEIKEQKVLSLPDIIYNTTYKSPETAKEKWADGVRILEVPHHHLQPAVEGTELSYFGKNESKDEKMDDE
ncbi:UNVERIFIED_CONTAM: hypothetical protein PYX00_004874 [Menopon gallinae]|uniref:CTCK domain-containing protein n=1 Tax=Menopon gallinae TaxID=328185 RepID=A0AAW2I7N5_9NEOP